MSFSVILFFIIAFIFFIYLIIRVYLVKSYYPCIPLSLVKRIAKTGDVVAYCHTGFRGRLIKLVTLESWLHVGVIWKRKEEIMVVELYYKDSKDRTLNINTLDEWVDKNRFRVLGVMFQNHDRKNIIPDTLFLKFISRYRDVQLDNNVIALWIRSFFKRTNHCFRDKMSCSEFAAHILQDIGIMDKKYCPCSYLPYEIFRGQYIIDAEK
jgi:hypothetical protein